MDAWACMASAAEPPHSLPWIHPCPPFLHCHKDKKLITCSDWISSVPDKRGVSG